MVGGTGTSRRQVVETVESQCGLPTNICSQAGKHQIQNCLAKPAQQSVQWTVGILRHFRVFSIPEQNLGLGVLSTPAPPPLTQTVGRLALELIYFYIRLLYNDFVPFITNCYLSDRTRK